MTAAFEEEIGLCPNCESSLHAACCAWCGKQSTGPYRLTLYCGGACSRAQLHADKISAEIEHGTQIARLTAATRRGLSAIRSLADVTASNGIDMTAQEAAEMQLAVLWIDHKMKR
jgi:hypothetical protein